MVVYPLVLQLPKLRKNQHQVAEASVSDTSLHKRTLSDRVKNNPLLICSSEPYFSNDDSESTFSTSSVSGRDLLLQNKQQTDSLPPEFRPVVTLINAQKLRTYCVGALQVPGIINSERVWFEVEAKLTGSELAIWRPLSDEYVFEEGNEFKPKYINVIDSHVEVVSDLEIKIYQDLREDAAVMLRFHDKGLFNKWMSAIILSKYEYEKLNEAFTAVILSSRDQDYWISVFCWVTKRDSHSMNGVILDYQRFLPNGSKFTWLFYLVTRVILEELRFTLQIKSSEEIPHCLYF